MIDARATLARRSGWVKSLEAVVALGICVSGCAPLTFSKERVIDFDRYPSVRVTVTSGNSQSDTAYLAEELRRDSGFASVTTDVATTTSLVLDVRLTVTEDFSTTSEGATTSSWRGDASYTASDAAGKVVDRGSEHDGSADSTEAAEDVLDRISLHYFRPFRI